LSAMGDAFDTAMQGLRVRYVERLDGAIGELKQFTYFAELDSLTPEMVMAVRALAHKLHGSGKTLGYPDISVAAGLLEQTLEPAPPPVEAARAASAALLKVCRDVVAAASTDKSPLVALAPVAVPEKPLLVCLQLEPAQHRMLSDVLGHTMDILTVTRLEEVDLAQAGLKCIVVDLDTADGGSSGIVALLSTTQAFGTPILALTAIRKAAAVARFIGDRRIDCLAKPVVATELYKKVQAALERCRRVVVIADDDRLVRELLKARFEAKDFSVVLAHDGEEVVELAREHRPSLVVLDRDMPKLEGLVALGMLEADPVTHEIPVIILASKAQPHQIREGRSTGAAEYALKPFAPADVSGRANAIRGISHVRVVR